jgi:hypothetical protein
VFADAYMMSGRVCEPKNQLLGPREAAILQIACGKSRLSCSGAFNLHDQPIQGPGGYQPNSMIMVSHVSQESGAIKHAFSLLVLIDLRYNINLSRQDWLLDMVEALAS